MCWGIKEYVIKGDITTSSSLETGRITGRSREKLKSAFFNFDGK